MGLEVTTEGIMTGTGTERDGGRVPNFGVATQSQRVPNEVRTNGAESRLVLESLRERVE